MAQIRVNGGADYGQFLVGSLTHYIVDAGADVTAFGWDDVSGNIGAGEELVQLISTVCNPVIIGSDDADANSLFFAAEVDGHAASDIANAINTSATFGSATVTEGVYTVTTP